MGIAFKSITHFFAEFLSYFFNWSTVALKCYVHFLLCDRVSELYVYTSPPCESPSPNPHATPPGHHRHGAEVPVYTAGSH